jgi:hypothetical protein
VKHEGKARMPEQRQSAPPRGCQRKEKHTKQKQKPKKNGDPQKENRRPQDKKKQKTSACIS